MGMDSRATFGYGFRVKSKKLVKKLDRGDPLNYKTDLEFDEDPNYDDLSFMIHCSEDENKHAVIIITESEKSVWEFDKPVCFPMTKTSKNFRIHRKLWDTKLAQAAEHLGEKFTKGRWYLVTHS